MGLMGLPDAAHYPEATMPREDGRLLVRFDGLGHEQAIDMLYVNERRRRRGGRVGGAVV
jgi:hypothetical protein